MLGPVELAHSSLRQRNSVPAANDRAQICALVHADMPVGGTIVSLAHFPRPGSPETLGCADKR